MNQPSLVISNTISIHAPATAVWDALVNPAQTKKYMFGCETVSDWKPGSALLWRGNYEGKEMDFVKGNIVMIEPNKFLAYTVIDPNNPSIPDIPQNYLTVTYTLQEVDDVTTLTVTQGDYLKVAEGEKRYNDSYNNGVGWQPILEQIKKIVEEKK
jgi:uncharacterized protein YndB with AHSA1/START domain